MGIIKMQKQRKRGKKAIKKQKMVHKVNHFFTGGEESRTPVQNHVHARSYKRSLRI